MLGECAVFEGYCAMRYGLQRGTTLALLRILRCSTQQRIAQSA
jgi:putative component of membrane protein insertase Oxa1/YidC/SpoIIIJ protein YidD